MNNALEALQDALKNKKNFAFFRLPHKKKIQLYLETTKPLSKKGLIVSGFVDQQIFVSEEKAFSLTPAEISDWEMDLNPKTNCKVNTLNKDEYLRLSQDLIEQLNNKENPLRKVVLTNPKIIKKRPQVLASFLALEQAEPSSFCYLLSSSNSLWIGATPELLVAQDSQGFTTTSLAGTLAIAQKGQWSNKEKEEQQMVTDYILAVLKKHHIKPQTEGPFTVENKQLCHLKTWIKTKVLTPVLLKKIINELHPTPAICGIPLKESKKYILENEAYNRELYTGYIGIQKENELQLYVNLRCAQFFSDKTVIYVGGGITAKSEPKKEWDELELKSQTILSILKENKTAKD